MKNNKQNIIFIIIIIFINFIFVSPTDVLAQTSFSLSPPVINLKLKPGQVISRDIRIVNNSPSAQIMSVRLKNLSTTYIDSFTDLPKWITLSAQKITIPPKKSVTVTVYVAVPVNQTPGNKKFNIIFQTFAKQTFPYTNSGSVSGNSSISSGIGNLLNITILAKEKVLGASNSPLNNLISSIWIWVAILTTSLIVLMIKEARD